MVRGAREFRLQLLGGCVQLTHSPQNIAGFVMQSGPPGLLRDRSAVLPQGFRQLSLLLEVPCRQLAYRGGIRRQTLQISKPLLGQIANDAAGLKLSFGIWLPCERTVYFLQRLRNAPQ